MNRRSFFSVLASIPFLGKWIRQETPTPFIEVGAEFDHAASPDIVAYHVYVGDKRIATYGPEWDGTIHFDS